MVVTPLADLQQEAVDVPVSARRLDKVTPDAARAAAFLAAASERIGQLPLLTSVVVTYDLAYDAAHDVGEALLAAHGYRTRNGAGQHEALGRFLRAVLDSSEKRLNQLATFVSDPRADARRNQGAS
ncbi:hypothetical protein ACFUTX_02060 [Microbacterium sp. NPDC057407]|uniref:hypothetical protein n=1 Tax=Microbacterium sp. NPDC057407 TaxID=3346120 RepID=UPI00366F0BB0